MLKPPLKHHLMSCIAILKAALALFIATASVWVPTHAAAADKTTAVLVLGSGTRIPLVSFSDSFSPPSNVAGQKVAKMGLLTVKYKLAKSGGDPFKTELAGKRIKTLKISLLNAGKSAGISYTFSNDMVASFRISAQGNQSYVNVVFTYSKVSAQGVPAGKTHPDSWDQRQ